MARAKNQPRPAHNDGDYADPISLNGLATSYKPGRPHQRRRQRATSFEQAQL